jgi:SAM-dependent methyltransferase
MSDGRRADTAEIVAELRAELDRLAAATPADPSSPAALGASLRRMHQTKGVTGDHEISVRDGALAPVKQAVKRGTRKATRWYVERLAVDVREFNDAATAAADSLAAWAAVLEARLGRFEEAQAAVAATMRADVDRGLAALSDRIGRLERASARRAGRATPSGGAPAPPDTAAAAAPATWASGEGAGPVHDFDYFAFEATMRGSREEITRRQAAYVTLFESVDDIVDVGCGRGEFLELLRGAGKRARGVDVDPDMVDQCRAAGLDVEQRDAVEWLAAAEPGSLGGVFAAQVVEHLLPAVLVAFLEAARRALAPGGVIVLETINPTSLSALRNYFADLTHSQPLVPETLRFLVESAGFANARIELTSPLPDHARLTDIPFGDSIPEEALVASRRNIEILNGILFAPQDYAVIAGG